MDANIGPSIMCTGYTDVGITLAGTGAGYVHEGQYERVRVPVEWVSAHSQHHT